MAGTERSPNYPAVSLEVAVAFARKFWDKEKRTAVAAELLAKALGHNKMSGPARSKIAALRQFGLVDVASGKFKLSERAMPLIHLKPGNPDYDRAIREAFLAPALFSDLAAGHSEESDDALRWHLMNDRKFSQDGARRAAETFRASMAFAGLDKGSYNGTGEQVGSEENSDLSFSGSEGADSTRPPAPPSRHPAPEIGRMSLDWILGGVKTRLTFDSAPTSHTIDRLMAYLKLLKDDLPSEGPPEPARPRDLEAEDEPA